MRIEFGVLSLINSVVCKPATDWNSILGNTRLVQPRIGALQLTALQEMKPLLWVGVVLSALYMVCPSNYSLDYG